MAPSDPAAPFGAAYIEAINETVYGCNAGEYCPFPDPPAPTIDWSKITGSHLCGSSLLTGDFLLKAVHCE